MKPLFTTLALAALASTVGCHQEEQSWAEYVDSVETTLQETGHCPLFPPQVPPQYGENARVPGPQGLRSSTQGAYGDYWVDNDGTIVYLDYGPGVGDYQGNYTYTKNRCILNGNDASSDANAYQFYGVFDVTQSDIILPPTVLYSVGSKHADAAIVFPTTTGISVAKSDNDRLVICLEKVVGPRGFWGDSPADWRGSAYLQVDAWNTTNLELNTSTEPLPTDFFIQLDGVGCARGEDASYHADPDYIVNWGRECDGIDNDLDGVIDEGQHIDQMDLDGNGVADCMDDWDGDGIPNTDDEDVDECCRGPYGTTY